MGITYSFIIPHKNNPELLLRCVNSIPRRQDIQIIVVDDDSSPGIVNWDSFEWGVKTCIELIRTKGCKSAGAVRNEGLKHAKGKWLLFADCDDFYVDGFIKVLDQYKDSELDALFYNIQCVDGKTYETSDVLASTQKMIREYKNHSALGEHLRYVKPPWTKMVAKRFIDEYHIQFEDVILGNDVWYSYQVGFWAKNTEVINEDIYVYTINPDSITFHRTVAKDVTQIEVYVKQNAFFNFIGHPEWHINLPGWIKYHWKKSNHKLKYITALLANAKHIYCVRNKYVNGIKKEQTRHG